MPAPTTQTSTLALSASGGADTGGASADHGGVVGPSCTSFPTLGQGTSGAAPPRASGAEQGLLLGQEVVQRVRVDRLREMAIEAGARGRLAIAVAAVARDGDEKRALEAA